MGFIIKKIFSVEYQRILGRKKHALLYGKNPKVFGIGFNKTGTTSLSRAVSELGFRVGDQRRAENLWKEYAERNFDKILKHSKTADFFQDFPYSCPYTYIALDQKFKNSKFILTIRDSPEQWYQSITKFHSNKWGKNGNLPTKEDLKNADYIYKGFPWKFNRALFQTPEEEPYQKEGLILSYERHIENVLDYFKERPESLLVLNVAEDGAYQKLTKFLNRESEKRNFPWLKKTPSNNL